MAFSPDGRMLASSTWDRAVRLWDVATGKALQCLRGHDGEAPCRCRTFGLAHPDCPVSGHANYVLAVCFSPSSELLASGGEDRSVKVLSLAFGRDWRSDQARLAVALALHPRLGSASRLNALEPEILRAILSDI
ncbi:WD40-repeat-containing domain protein [Baffinella frigidus]|nr:WD40-repeat-containing domain protein [Cryptophyta sp. CCMP2293]